VGGTKYGGGGPDIDLRHLDLGEHVKQDLSKAVKHSIAVRTWASYRSAERLLAQYCIENRKPLNLPVDESTVLGFIHWLAFKRGLSAATISGYLAGIKKLHETKGLPDPVIRTKLVQMVLEGKKNMETSAKLRQDGQGRQPVTPDIMALLKARLREWVADNIDKLSVWAVATLLFHGAFRGGEIMCRLEATFDPAFTLLRKDILIVPDSNQNHMIQVKVKAPKEDKKGSTIIVDIFQSDTDMCPVKAMLKWEKATEGMEEDQPAFRFSCGTPITCAKFNAILKDRLGGLVSGISCHSFRIGAASMMGTLGFSDKEVKAVGRWGSRAFEGYMRLPRTKRMLVARKLAKYSA
jgi:hypothetical protein